MVINRVLKGHFYIMFLLDQPKIVRKVLFITGDVISEALARLHRLSIRLLHLKIVPNLILFLETNAYMI